MNLLKLYTKFCLCVPCRSEAIIFIILKRGQQPPKTKYNEIINKFKFLSSGQVPYYKTRGGDLGKRSEALTDNIFSHYPERDLLWGLNDHAHITV